MGLRSLFERLIGRKEVASFNAVPKAIKGPFVKWRKDSYPLDVVGESAFQSSLIAICGPHSREGHDGVYDAMLVREPTNPHDRNAVRVEIDRRQVGYLSREQAARVSTQMKSDGVAQAWCQAKIRGGWRTNQYDEGSYGVKLGIPAHGWIDFGVGATRPPPTKATNTVRPEAKPRPAPSVAGALSGKKIAIMGAPNDGPLASELAQAGARIMSGVGKTTHILVVAANRPFDFGTRRSASYKKAEELIAGGAEMKIFSLSEVRAAIRDGLPEERQ